MAFDLAICNTFFQKKDRQFVTYKSGSRESQIEEKLSEIRNCKVIKGGECGGTTLVGSNGLGV